MQIKAFSKAYSVGEDTIRYYEKIGLLQPKRLANGYRQYDAQCAYQLKMVIVLKQLGFSLEEIAQLIVLEQQELTAACNEAAVSLFDRKIQQLTERLAFYVQALQTLKKTKTLMAEQQYVHNQQEIERSIEALFETLRRTKQDG